MSAPAQGSTPRASRGRGGGGGGGGAQKEGGGGNENNKSARGHRGGGGGGSQAPPAAQGTRFSALGNPLPPLREDSAVHKEGPPTISSGGGIPPTPPPTVSRNLSMSSMNSTGSAATDRSKGEGRGRRRGGGGGGAGGGGGGGGMNHGNQTPGHGSTGGGAASQSRPVEQAPKTPQWPKRPEGGGQKNTAQSKQPASAPMEKGDFPEVLNASEWGDDEDNVTQEMVEQRLRTQVERLRNEKQTTQKQMNDAQAELEKAKSELSKYKSETDQIKTQADKTAIVEKSYAALRQTRDALETERDTLKKSLMKFERDSKTEKDEAEITITKLRMEVDTLNATVAYLKLELEDVAPKSGLNSAGGSSRGSSTPGWLYACSAGVRGEQLADELSFSSLEMSKVNISTWSNDSDVGFKHSLAAIAFERGGEKLNAESPSFSQEVREAFSRMLTSSDVLLVVAKRPESVSTAKYDEYVKRLVQLCSEARAASHSPKNFALVLEDFTPNRVVLDGAKPVPVSFIPI